VNDNAPVFDSHQYSVNISEAAPVGTALLTLSASDADTGVNARLSYRAEPHPAAPDDVALFHVDAERGLVLIRGALDREQAARLRYVLDIALLEWVSERTVSYFKPGLDGLDYTIVCIMTHDCS